jgi:hypothetical protein
MMASGVVGSRPREWLDSLAASVAASFAASVAAAMACWRAGTGAGRVRKGPCSWIAWPRQLGNRDRNEVTDTSIC